MCCKSQCKHVNIHLNSSPNDKNLDWTKLKAFADDKINVNETLKLVFGRVENIVGKGENAGYQHFLLFPQCFQKLSLSGSLKSQDCVVKVLKGNTGTEICLTLYHTIPSFNDLDPFPNKPWFLRVCSTCLLKNNVGNGEIARNEQFLLFPHCFLPVWRTSCHFHQL